MSVKFFLHREGFSEANKLVFEGNNLSATTFKYSTGVEAVTLKNKHGYVTLLPFMGQMIWDMEFLGKNLVMKSIFDEPEIAHQNFCETYGCFLMHCGLTAMGNPSPEDTHTPHGELPIATYKTAYIVSGEDEKGRYVSLGGVYTHKRCSELNYEFIPECRLYEDATTIDINIDIKNNKDLDLEYFYLCHINYLPVDGSKLYYTAKHEDIVIHREVPEGYPGGDKTNEYIDRLEKDISIMDTVDKTTQSYAPEIVFTCKYYADENGNAHSMQLMPDGYSTYICHRPEELPVGVRWICRTEDEDAIGVVLPATAEHKGYIYCKEKGYGKILKSGEKTSIHLKTGILSPSESKEIINKIQK